MHTDSIELYEKALKKLPFSFCKEYINISYDKEHIVQILPHRDPFLLIDHISQISLAEKMIHAKRYIAPEDPVFKGHFPNNPVYPGVLQIEMMGQAGLCLAYFLKNETISIDEEQVAVKGLFVKVHKAVFIQPILPKDSVSIFAQLVEQDDFLGIVACQIIKDNKVSAYGILEVYFDE